MTRFSTATALGVILAASPALAEITPGSVWEQLSTYYETMGLTVTTEDVEEAGDTVTVRGLSLSQSDDTGSIDAQLGDLVLTATGDGGVTVDMADEWTGTASFEAPIYDDEDDATMAPDATDDTTSAAEDAATDDAADADTTGGSEAEDAADAETTAPDAADDQSSDDDDAETQEMGTVEVAFTATNPGETITVNDDGGANLYEFAFPTMEVVVDSVIGTDGMTYETPLTATITNFTGTERIDSTDGFKLVQTGAADSVALTVDFADDNASADISGTISDIAYNSDTNVPAGTELGPDLTGALKAGLDISGDMTASDLDFQVDMEGTNDEGTMQTVSIASKSADLALDVMMANGMVGYSGTSGATTVDATLPDMPMPINYASDSAEFNIEMPLVSAAEPQPFKFVYGLTGLTLSDSIWAMFDPQSALPRDPANVHIDVSGTATLDVDLTDQNAMSDPSVAPGEFNSVSINNVDISALGASVSATGELNSPEGGNMTTPVGVINGRLEGINALFDKLIEAGMMPQEQAMGVRMMLAMFAKPDPENAEVMTSEIEFREGGSIFANGQQVK
ncbi:DUF2125 domain-containing protein [Paracoccus albus]|uniref:DUF2125 domain-containing protein n=1 Tax=Paracoccus albus TaxID=3017784 RepID=UPI0022EFDC66|nr:DUF2125 domain-containing protein [Paracoccus albus]WBU59988.1 DUF2125 domain-containing protein [Paracoccus albus]